MSKTDLLARLEALAGFARHTTLCGIIGGYNRCTCGLEEVEAHLPDIIAALRAGEWQPIETAPKDGTRVLVGCTSYLHWTSNRPEDVHAAWWDGIEEKWMVERYNGHALWQPTHWRALPTPPAKETPTND